jgi:hypothetical protein
MTDLLLLCILSGLKPDVEKQLENQLFSLVGILLRVAFVILGVALCVGWAIVYPGPTVGLLVIFALFSIIAVLRQKYVNHRSPSSPRPIQPPANKDLELEANGHTVLFNRLMR